jgi:hypothetical protein
MMIGRPMKALPALLIALIVGAVLAVSQRNVGPSRAELARALSNTDGDRVAAADIRSLKCEEAPGGFACRWKQFVNEKWVDRTGAVKINAGGWHTIAGTH